MALSVTHTKVSGRAAGSDPDRVYGTHWDAAHTLTGSVSVEQGGTGLTSYTIGDILYASTTTALAGLAGVAVGSVLVSGGVGAAPAWSSSPTITGAVTAARFVPSSSTAPTDGMYLPAANTLGWAVNSAAELQLTATALSPAVSDGNALGTTSLMWADLFLASGGVVNWNNGDVTVTHSANALAFAGASSGYSFDAVVAPTTSDGAALGSTSLMWSDLFLASGAVLNFNNGNYTITHSSGLLTFSAAVNIASTTASTAYTNGALVVSGGLGVAKDLFVGGTQVNVQSAGNAYVILNAATSYSTGFIFYRNGSPKWDMTNNTSDLFYMWNYGVSDVGFSCDGATNAFSAKGVYTNTDASAANVYVNSSGQLKRSTSSLAYKENVEDYSRGLADVMKIRPVFFSPKDSKERFGGFIAEEIFDAGLTEFVALRDGKPDALHYGHMTALAIKGIQEHKSETDRMAEEIVSLRKRVAHLETAH